ncbi:hypothetical protein AGMMS50284_5940 [Clostridia bacterium]|nr:hypothetical protein AGMMS50284_5940 [Clostridia bacterium]
MHLGADMQCDNFILKENTPVEIEGKSGDWLYVRYAHKNSEGYNITDFGYVKNTDLQYISLDKEYMDVLCSTSAASTLTATGYNLKSGSKITFGAEGENISFTSTTENSKGKTIGAFYKWSEGFVWAYATVKNTGIRTFCAVTVRRNLENPFYACTIKGAKIYTGASIETPVTTLPSENTKLKVVAKAGGNWYYVESDDKKTNGYIQEPSLKYITFDYEYAHAIAYSTTPLKIKAIAHNFTASEISWSSANHLTAQIKSSSVENNVSIAVVTPKGEGYVEIKTQAINGKIESKCRLSVRTSENEVGTINKSTMLLGGAISTAPSQETIAKNTKVTIIGTCSLYFVVKVPSGAWGYVYKTDVDVKIKSLKMSAQKLHLSVGGTYSKLHVYDILPTYATNKNMIWYSDNPNIATVTTNKTGNVTVTALKKGTTFIVAKAEDGGGAYVTCNIEVKQLVTDLQLQLGQMECWAGGDTIRNGWTIYPANANNQTLKWSSDTPSVAWVNENTGYIQGKSEGWALITAKTTDGSNISRSFWVWVYPKQTSSNNGNGGGNGNNINDTQSLPRGYYSFKSAQDNPQLLMFATHSSTYISDYYYPIIPGIGDNYISRRKERNEDLRMQAEVDKILAKDEYSERSWSLAPLTTFKGSDIKTKKDILNDLFKEAKNAMNLTIIADEISYFNQSVENSKITLGQYSNYAKEMSINEGYLEDSNSYAILKTLVHELRHCYQHESVDNLGVSHKISSQTAKIWRENLNDYNSGENGMYSYTAQPIEYDAMMFAEQYKSIIGVWPNYVGSWADKLYEFVNSN